MNRIYEEMFILRPDATEEEITPIVDQLKSTVTSAGGTVAKVERWGVRKLAYRVEKRHEGDYVLMPFTAGPQTVKEVDRRLRVNDAVLKYMTVRIDEKLKKIEKRKKVRDKRAARKPAPVVAPPMPLEAMMPSEPRPAGPMPGAPVPESPETLPVQETAGENQE